MTGGNYLLLWVFFFFSGLRSEPKVLGMLSVGSTMNYIPSPFSLDLIDLGSHWRFVCFQVLGNEPRTFPMLGKGSTLSPVGGF
jgi:hypothetical protein